MTRKCRLKDYHPYIDDYIDGCRSGKIVVEEEDIFPALDLVEERLNRPNVFIDKEKTEKAVELIERYFKITLFDWELFVLALIHCYYSDTDTVVFDTIILIMGRGNGKNGFISALSWYLSTHYHGIKNYNIEIIANSEKQAQTSFFDIYEMLEENWKRLVKFFYKTKEVITNLKTRSKIRFHTSSAGTKDGGRPGCLIFDEVHQYKNYDLMDVFTTGFGKKEHSRTFIISTDGDVREGVIDDYKNIIEDILNGTIKDLNWLPLYYRVKKEEELKMPEMWHKANPSLKYLPTLQSVINKEFIEMKYKPSLESAFYTKRMNHPKGNREFIVAEWGNVLATKKEIPDLTGWSCIVGIDFSKIDDWAAINYHFRDGEKRYDISHAWMCKNGPNIDALKVPWEKWGEEGLITVVDEVEISANLIAEHMEKMMEKYNITAVCLDNYRYALMADALRKIGFDAKNKEGEGKVYLLRPSDIAKIQPVISSCFNNQNFYWNDNPVLRWATNNTKLKESGNSGTYYYAKIGRRTRKNDPFMALVASMAKEELLPVIANFEEPDLGVYTY